MQRLQPSAEIVTKVLQSQKPSDGTCYRPMTYCVVCDADEETLVYNVLTKQYISLTPSEAKAFSQPFVYVENEATECVRELIAHRFLVPEDHDDYTLCLQVRQLAKLLSARKEKTKSYTILTTTDCNARCFYCYELGRSRITMTEQTAHEVADYISAPKIALQWFGGEPLYNRSAIDIICQDLQSKGCDYSSEMVSNAYLFDEAMVEKATELWHLKKVQVTLDGTEPVYNRCKAFLYKEGSAYRRVLRNVGLLLDAGIKVSIRLNIDMHNAEDLLLLVEELKQRFADKNGLSVYSHIIFEESLKHNRSEEERKRLYAKQDLLDERISQLGLSPKKKLSTEIKVNHCKVDSGSSEIILPDGHIGLCEHYTEDHFIGHISSKEQDQESIRQQREIIDEEACHSCPVFPSCIRLRVCENNLVCYPEDRAKKIKNIQQTMMETRNH